MDLEPELDLPHGIREKRNRTAPRDIHRRMRLPEPRVIEQVEELTWNLDLALLSECLRAGTVRISRPASA
jgi:hypothetical protein